MLTPNLSFWLAWLACFLGVVGFLAVMTAIREYWLYRKENR
jgi:hypothetical protein